MKTRDIAFTLTTAYQKISTLISADSDHNDVSGQSWKNVTITNNTDVTIQIKNSAKSSVSGTGRGIASGESFNYLELNPSELFVKANSTPTGSLVITFNQE